MNAGHGRLLKVAQRRSFAKLPDYGDHHYGARHSFHHVGLPKDNCSDNGPQFGSKQFEDWCRLNSIEHLTSAPFHPPSIGEAKRLVGVFKMAMRGSMGEEGEGKDKATMDFLRDYRSTPNCVMG